jgi:hypothetical protein
MDSSVSESIEDFFLYKKPTDAIKRQPQRAKRYTLLKAEKKVLKEGVLL